ncbi:uncharacterized protein LOC119545203 [Choloepus didactylus]|uniref:uncharacterized protein LOC119545203 n=1 Tax=Choloepus didactylus TaxID=27675 RepID=UPI0018A08903|nr:uncharacterized protein LOC119545203 [Choloepus didactylus]
MAAFALTYFCCEVSSEKRTAQGRTSAQGGSEEQSVRFGAGPLELWTRERVAPAGEAGAAGSPRRASPGRQEGRAQGADLVSSGDLPGHVGSGQPPPPPPAPPPALSSSAFAPRHGRAACACPRCRLRTANLIPRSSGHRRGSPPGRRRRSALVRPAQSRARKWRRVSDFVPDPCKKMKQPSTIPVFYLKKHKRKSSPTDILPCLLLDKQPMASHLEAEKTNQHPSFLIFSPPSEGPPAWIGRTAQIHHQEKQGNKDLWL